MRISKIKLISVMTIATVLLTSFGTFPYSDEVDAGPSSSWTCTITADSDSGEITVTYTKDNQAQDVQSINGKGSNQSERDGSWGFDEKGYGPFNCFYAAFDLSGNMICHLNPYDLSKNVDTSDSTDYSNGNYNIMWVLPKLYATASGNTLTLSSIGEEEDIYPAFRLYTRDGLTQDAPITETTYYNYLAIGVYEATSTNDALSSVSGKSPKSGLITTQLTSIGNTRSSLAADGDVEVAQIWNYYQWQAYRLCSIAVMGSLDSRSVVGNGNVDSSYATNTGTMNDKGAYYGTNSECDGVKLFIENSWGSLKEYVSDAFWTQGDHRLFVGTNMPDWNNPVDQSNKERSAFTPMLIADAYGIYTDDVTTWGFPFSSERSGGAKFPEYVYSNGYDQVVVGGDYKNGLADAGLSVFGSQYNNDDDEPYLGSRIAYLFDTDSTTTKKVSTFDQLKQASNDSNIAGILATEDIELSEDITISEGKTITIASDKTLTVPEGKSLTVSDGSAVVNKGTISIEGTVSNGGKLTNEGQVNNSGTLKNTGDGAIENKEGSNISTSGSLAEVSNSDDGTSIKNSGTIENEGGSIISNSGTIVNEVTGTITTDSSSAMNTYGGTTTNKGSITNDGVLVGSITNDRGTESGSTTVGHLLAFNVESGGDIQSIMHKESYILTSTNQLEWTGNSVALTYWNGTDVITATPSVGYEFLAWSESPTSVTNNLTITATFRAVSMPTSDVVVTFDSNGGSCEITSKSAQAGGSITLPESSLKKHVFKGWYIGDNLIGYAGDSYTLSGNVTLKAVYEVMPSSITDDDDDETSKQAKDDDDLVVPFAVGALLALLVLISLLYRLYTDH